MIIQYQGYTCEIEPNQCGGLYYKVRDPHHQPPRRQDYPDEVSYLVAKLTIGDGSTTDYRRTPHWSPDWVIRFWARRSIRSVIRHERRMARFRPTPEPEVVIEESP